MPEENIPPINQFKAHNDLNFYFNAKNISNQNLVFETYNFFEKGIGKPFFVGLDFLNLLYWNYSFINENIERPFDVLNHLRLLTLSKIESHILLGFILKWFGGSPISNLNNQYNTTLKLIEENYLRNIDFVAEPLVFDQVVDAADKGFKNYKGFIMQFDAIVTRAKAEPSFLEREKTNFY